MGAIRLRGVMEGYCGLLSGDVGAETVCALPAGLSFGPPPDPDGDSLLVLAYGKSGRTAKRE